MAISGLIEQTIAQHITQPKVLSYAPTKLDEVQGRFVASNRVYNFVLNKKGISYSPAGQGDSLLFSALYLRQDAVRKPKVGNDKCNAGKSYQCGKICLGNRRKCHKGVRDVNDARRIASILESTNEQLKNKVGSEVSAKAKARGEALFEARGKRSANPKLKSVKDIVNGDLTKLSDSELEDLHKMRMKEFELGDPEGEKIREAINRVQRKRADPAKYEKDEREANDRKAAIEAKKIQRAKELDPKALAKLPKNKDSIEMHFEALANKFKGANLHKTSRGLTHGAFNKDDQESLNGVRKSLDDAGIKYTGGWTGSNSNNSYQISISTRDENLKKVRSFLTKP